MANFVIATNGDKRNLFFHLISLSHLKENLMEEREKEKKITANNKKVDENGFEMKVGSLILTVSTPATNVKNNERNRDSHKR